MTNVMQPSPGSGDDEDGFRFPTSATRPRLSFGAYHVDSVQEFASEILQVMDNEKLRNLRKLFEASSRGMKLHEFVHVLKRMLRSIEEDSTESRLPIMSDEELVSNLCELFSQVDVNGDGELEWEEFSSFVLEMGMNKIGASGNTDSIKEYKQGRVMDRSVRSVMTAQMKYFPPLGVAALTEDSSDVIRFYDADGKQQRFLKLGSHSKVKAVDHLPFANQLVISTSAPALLFVDDNLNSSAFNAFTSEYRHTDDFATPRGSRYKASVFASHPCSSDEDSGEEDPPGSAREHQDAVAPASEAPRLPLIQRVKEYSEMLNSPSKATRLQTRPNKYSGAAPVGIPRRSYRILTPTMPQQCVAGYGAGRLVLGGGIDGVITGWDVDGFEERLSLAVTQLPTIPIAIDSVRTPHRPSARSNVAPSPRPPIDVRNTPRRPAFARMPYMNLVSASEVNAVTTSPTWQSLRLDHYRPTAVLDLLCVPELDLLLSGSMDSMVRMWDIRHEKLKQELKGHTNGVRSVAYSHPHKLILSAGFDHTALVWNPFMEKSVFTLRGHNAPLVRVIASPDSPEAVTADADGVIKIWDIRMFTCVQTLNKSAEDGLGDVALILPRHRILGCGHKLFAFDYDSLSQPDLADDANVSLAVYNPTSATFITACGADVKIWDASTGHLVRIHRDITSCPITSLILDDRERKFITGDHGGNIQVFDYVNGACLKVLHKHDREVSCLVYCPVEKAVLSASWDRSLEVTDESNPDKGITIKTATNAHDCDITAVAYSIELSLIASGDASGLINLWDFEFLKHDGVCLGHTTAVKGLCFFAPYPVLAACDAGGNIALWSVRGARKAYELLCRVVNTDRLVPPLSLSLSSSVEPPVVNAITSGVPTPQGGGESAFLTQRKEDGVDNHPLKLNIPTEPTVLGTRLVPVPVLTLSAHVKWNKHCQCDPKDDDCDEAGGDTDDESVISVNASDDDAPLGPATRKKSSFGASKDPIVCVGQCGRHVSRIRLFAGDDDGNVKMFDVLGLLKHLDAAVLRPLKAPHLRRFPKRYSSINFKDGLRPLAASKPLLAYKTAVKQQAIFHLGKEPPLDSSALSGCLRRCWSAHTDAIASLQVTSHPKSVVTCGFDKRVCVWSWKGDPLGSLKQRNVVQKFAESQVMDLDGTGQLTGASTVAMDTSWAFKPDLEGRHNGLHNVAKRAAFEAEHHVTESRRQSTNAAFAPADRKKKSDVFKWGGGSVARKQYDPAFWSDMSSSPLNNEKRPVKASGRRSSEFDEQLGSLSVEDGRKLFYTGSPPGNFKDDDVRVPEDVLPLRSIPAIQPVTPATAGRSSNLVHAGLAKRKAIAARLSGSPP